MVIIGVSLFLNCSTGLDHKTEKGPLVLLGPSLSMLFKNKFYDILVLIYVLCPVA